MGVAEDTASFEAAYERVERNISLLLRRARGSEGAVARAIHPDLDPAAYGLLVCIDEGAARRVTDLARILGVGKPTISRQLEALEARGLVARTTGLDDARSTDVRLTDLGHELLQQTRAARREDLKRRLAGWSLQDLEDFSRLCHAYVATA